GEIGDEITYVFEVENTGNVTLSDVIITDPLPNIGTIVYDTWPGVDRVLAPQEKVTATAIYTLTKADLDAGQVINTASVTGTPGSGPAIPPVNSKDPTPEDPADPKKTIVTMVASDLA